MSRARLILPLVGVWLIAGMIWVIVRRSEVANKVARAPLVLDDSQQFEADNGKADRFGFSYFDELARDQWHLEGPLGSNFAGWRHTEVECKLHLKAHVIAFFVMTHSEDDPAAQYGFTWKFFACSDSRTGRLIKGCGGLVTRPSVPLHAGVVSSNH
jgi:hypothetical protein